MTPLDADPVSDDELIYRRIPVSQGYYDPRVAPVPSPLALSPLVTTPPDSRCIARKYTSLETAARGRPGKSYYIAVLRAGDLRAAGIEVVSRLLEDAPGHAEIPGLTHEHRKSMPYFEWQTLLAEELCLRVEGPYPSASSA